MLNRLTAAPTQAKPDFTRSFSFVVLLILASGSIFSGYIESIRRHNVPEFFAVTLVLAAAGVTVGVCLRAIKQSAPENNSRQEATIIAVLLIIAMAGLLRDFIHVIR